MSLDWSRCQGHRVCVAAFRERLRPDRWGYPDGIPTSGTSLTGSELDAARLAVATCPTAALRLHLG